MPRKYWLPLLLLAFCIGALLASDWLVVFSAALFFFYLTAWVWKKYALIGVHYTRKFHFHRLFPGESTQVRLTIENRKWLPLSWLRISDNWPEPVGPAIKNSEIRSSPLIDNDTLVSEFSLLPNEQVVRKHELTFQKRGVYTVGPTNLEAGDYFGMFATQAELPARTRLTVYPQLIPLQSLKLSTDDPFGDRSANRRLFEDPNAPMGVRSYHPEDEFRRIHWGATARTGSLQVKVYQPVSARVMMVCLNVVTTEKPWLGLQKNLLEYLISATATLCYQGIQEGFSVGLLSNGCLTQADQPFRILPGRTTEQLALMLESLASVTPYHTLPFEEYLSRSLPGLPYGASLVLVTGIVSPVLIETLIRLRRYRLITLLFSFEKNHPGDIPGVRVIHLPFEEVHA